MRSLRSRTTRFFRRINWSYWSAWIATLMLLASFLVWRTLTTNLRYFGSSIDWEWSLAASGLDCVFLVWFLASGAAIGSFVNVMAYRMPLGISINGVSRCPYCHTSLSALENCPIFGWIRLRGRCNTCRLPISPRYLLVEMWMMVVFGAVYFSEFMTGGINLPSQAYHRLSIDRLTMASPFVPITLLYLWCEASLVAVSLFALTRKAVPASLTFWAVLPCFLVPLVQPNVIQVSWESGIAPAIGDLQLDSRFDAVLTVTLGGFFGIVAAVAYNSLTRTARRFFVRNDHASQLSVEDLTQSRAGQLVTGLAIAGALMGWQAIVLIAPLSLLIATAILPLGRRFTDQNSPSNLDPACTVWLAVLISRATWHSWW